MCYAPKRKSTWTRFWDDVNENYSWDSCTLGEERGPEPTYVGYILLTAYWHLKHIILSLSCRWWGHDVEMDGWAGPDSGEESWHCKRCGDGGSHTYY